MKNSLNTLPQNPKDKILCLRGLCKVGWLGDAEWGGEDVQVSWVTLLHFPGPEVHLSKGTGLAGFQISSPSSPHPCDLWISYSMPPNTEDSLFCEGWVWLVAWLLSGGMLGMKVDLGALDCRKCWGCFLEVYKILTSVTMLVNLLAPFVTWTRWQHAEALSPWELANLGVFIIQFCLLLSHAFSNGMNQLSF